MRIGLILESPIKSGGGFQQSLTMIKAINALDEHEAIVLTTIAGNLSRLRELNIDCREFHISRLRLRLDILGASDPGIGKAMRLLSNRQQHQQTSLDRRLTEAGIDLAYFLGPSALPRAILSTPYISTVWDIAHREHTAFPEVREGYSEREAALVSGLPRAFRVVISSDSLRHKLTDYYGVPAERQVIIPFLPSEAVIGLSSAQDCDRVRHTYSLPDEFIFYPAQFWAHKNHVYILEALRLLEHKYDRAIHAVFCGSDTGNLAHVRSIAVATGLVDRVHFLGFVADHDLAPLYSAARALVMPSYFGPTNLPPLEAMAAGCPVIYSDFPEFREDLGDAALYCDLQDPSSLADLLAQVLIDTSLVAKLREAGKRRLARVSKADISATLAGVFAAYDQLRGRWVARK